MQSAPDFILSIIQVATVSFNMDIIYNIYIYIYIYIAGNTVILLHTYIYITMVCIAVACILYTCVHVYQLMTL